VSKTRPGQGRCRIIGGQWRGRKINFDEAQGLRPTTDRIRETVFNWLQADVAGSVCLDLFAGSGALGFEAASRGASRVVMLDNNRRTVINLEQNLTRLKAENISLYQADGLQWLAQEHRELVQSVDIVFLDPPFHTPLLQQSCQSLAQSGLLSPEAKIYIEHALNDTITYPSSWCCLKTKAAGQVAYKMFAA